MAITINHQTNDISATTGSITIDGADIPGGGGGGGLTVGTVTANDVDLSTGNVFEITADNQTLSFSGSPATHEFKLKVTGAGVTTGFGLGTASYDNNSVNIFSQESSVNGVALSTDGTRMFITGSGADTVFQYDLTTAFDLSTASYDSVNYSLSSESSQPQDIFFNTDGTKMFIIDGSNYKIFQYTLTTGFDLSTASYDSVEFNFGSQETSGSAIAFSLDGTSLFLIGITTDTIYQYALSTGFDLSTTSYTGKSFSVASEQTAPYGMGISNNGGKLFVVGGTPRVVRQYDLSTVFDLDTASDSGVELDVSAENGPGPSSIHFDPLGIKMFISSNRLESVFRYSMGTSVVNADVNYPSSVTFPDDTAPALSEIGGVRTVSLYTINTGTNFYEC
jgi:hypothetical protein